MKNFKKDIFFVGCSNICILHSVEFVSHHITPRTVDLLEHFGEIMNKRGVKLKDVNEKLFHAVHLALTFIQIKDLKRELKELQEDLNLNER